MRVSWAQLADQVSGCTACALCEGCIQKVLGQGDPKAPLMLIGEGPGEQEDKRGEAFVGRAGELLTNMLAAIDLPRERVYICNAVKCRPPQNRTPRPDELDACRPHLLRQIALVKPKVIFLLGATAVRVMLGPNYRITQCRGQWYQRGDIRIMATFHPAALLRDPRRKHETWADLKMVRKELLQQGAYPDLLS
ncbi:MAG: uracil-DNA glycosylase [Clostridiales bacterium]|nr:uracil-DNA glycosylase [Clostridiales bacterium]